MVSPYRFLFDECLSPDLSALAHSLGFEATSVRDLNRLGDPDEALAAFAVARDWVVVTNNRVDFLRLYLRFDLHPGLVILLPNVGANTQLELFLRLCERLDELGDLTNKRVEVGVHGAIEISDWPPQHRNAS